MADLSDHVRRNREAWDGWAADFYSPGRRAWTEPEPQWGLWGVRESELRLLGDIDGRDVLEAGLRDGLLVGLAGQGWSASGGHRQLRPPARERS